jgi:Zn-dependent protease with chaperone function
MIKKIYEKFWRRKIETITQNNYPTFFEAIRKKCKCSVKSLPQIKIINEKKKFWTQRPLFLNSIYFTKAFWDVLTFNERIAVTLHEVGHIVSHFEYLYVVLIILPFILIGYFFSYPWNLVLTLIWFFGRGLAVTVCSISLLDEKSADDFAAKKINKKYLINALKKFQAGSIPSHPKILSLLFFSPLKTHLSIEERIKRLEER